MSVCQCRTEESRLGFRVYSTSASDYPSLSNGNQEITLTPEEVSNAGSVVFFDSKLKAPYEIRFEYKMEDDDAGSVWNTADGISIMIGKDASAYNDQNVPHGSDRAFIKDGSGYGVHFELYGTRKITIRDGHGSPLSEVRTSSIFRNGEWQSVKIKVSETSIIVFLNDRKLIFSNRLSIEDGYLGFGASTGAADGANHIRNIFIKDWSTELACAQPDNVNDLVSREDEEDSLLERLGDTYADIVESLRDSLAREGQDPPILASTDEDGVVIEVSTDPAPAFLQALHAPSSEAELSCSEEQSQIGFRKAKSTNYIVEAGPIWNREDGRAKCPDVCRNDDAMSAWTGHWWTTEWNKMSVCMCERRTIRRRDYTLEAGPIWNNAHAQRRCPAVCPSARSKWTGHWWTTVWGRMSVCQCREEENQSSFQGFSAGFANQSYPKRVSESEMQLLPDPSGVNTDTERASAVFFDTEVQTPYTLEFEYKVSRTGTSLGASRGGLAVLLSKDASSYLTQSLPRGIQRGFINDGSGYGVHFDVYSEMTEFDVAEPKGIYLKDGNGGVLSSLSDTSVARLDEWQKVTIRVTEDSIEVKKDDKRLYVDSLSISNGAHIGIAASSNTESGDEYRIRNISVNACR